MVAPDVADTALEMLQSVEGGEEASIIGEIREEPARMVLMHTGFGSTRMIDMIVGDPLSRISQLDINTIWMNPISLQNRVGSVATLSSSFHVLTLRRLEQFSRLRLGIRSLQRFH